MEEEKNYILFDAYLLNDLKGDELEAFKLKLKTDANFAATFKTYKELHTFLDYKFKNETESQSFQENLKKISEKHFIKNRYSPKIENTNNGTKLYKYAIAACITLFIGIYTFNSFSTPSYSDFSNHETISLTVRGDHEKLLNVAEHNFNTKNFAKAKIALKKLLIKNPNNTELKLYYAITSIETNEFKVADKLLDSIRSGTSVYTNKASWYLALSKLKQNHKKGCISILKTISKDADDYEQAQKLMNKLK